MNAYLKNIWNAIQGKRSESFADADASAVAAAPSEQLSKQLPIGGFGILVLGLFSLLPFFIYCYGAAKLSWCLNHSYGWSILCFFFPGLYYPFYAFFLNPLCMVQQVGGRRR